MPGSSRRTGKRAYIATLSALVGVDPPATAGGTVPTEWLLQLAQALPGSTLAITRSTKRAALRRLVEQAGGTWSNDLVAAGGTIPGETLQMLVRLIDTNDEQQLPFLTPSHEPTMPESASPESLESLCDQISELSNHDHDYPKGFGDQPVALEPEDVDLISNRWLAQLATVQGWLRLEAPWDPTAAPPAQVLRDLFDMLGAESPDECVCEAGGVSLPTELGASRLQLYLNTAAQHRTIFADAIDEGASLKYATQQWADAWDEEDVSTSDEPVSVHAAVDTWKLKDFVDNAEGERLELNPSYQRDAVWSTTDSQRLIDSILRGIPLPSIILNRRQGSDVMEIVDGKQRLTAILRFIGRHPDGVRYAAQNFPTEDMTEFKQDYRSWRRKHGVKSAQEKDNFLPFPLRRYPEGDPLHGLAGRYYCEVRNETVQVQGQDISIWSLFEGSTKDYEIPVILYKNTPINQIHRVFGLYNKQGKHLNAEELRNAIFHHLDVTRLILLLSGDAGETEPTKLVLAEVVQGIDLDSIPSLLNSINVRTARFRSSKFVGWLVALICSAPKRKKSGAYSTPSTASFINRVLEQVHESHNHELRAKRGQKNLAADLVGGAQLLDFLHIESEAFAPSFVSRKPMGTSKWADLPTIAALTACTFAVIGGVSPDSLDDDLIDGLMEVTAANSMQPPEKQQSRTQWEYLGRTVVALLEAMQVDVDELSTTLDERYGISGLEALRQFGSEV